MWIWTMYHPCCFACLQTQLMLHCCHSSWIRTFWNNQLHTNPFLSGESWFGKSACSVSLNTACMWLGAHPKTSGWLLRFHHTGCIHIHRAAWTGFSRNLVQKLNKIGNQAELTALIYVMFRACQEIGSENQGMVFNPSMGLRHLA